MHSCPLGPTELFGHGRRYVLLPQPRPDLGMLPEQVEEVWARVCSRAKSLLPQGQVEPWAHMFGTVALAPRTHPGRREVVYGGQCLVILRSLLEVVRDLAVDHGLRAQAQSLDPLVETEVFLEPCLDGHRPAAHPAPPGWNTQRAQHPHTVLAEQVTHWLQGPDPTERLEILVRTVRDHLQVMIVDLDPTGRALTTNTHTSSVADRVRDLLLSAAEEQGSDTVWLHNTFWAPFDHGHWRKQGKERTHVDEFLGVWLTMRLGEPVPPNQVVPGFDALVQRQEAADILQQIAKDAPVHRSMRAMPPVCLEGEFAHRAVDVCGAVSVLPLQLLLMRSGPSRVPAGQRKLALRALESWIVRRTLCEAPIEALEGLVVELLNKVGKAAPERAGEVIADHLAAQRDASRQWIDDLRLREVLSTAPVALALAGPRLEMVLESLENAMRSPLREEPPCPSGLSVEYVMPPKWHEHWGEGVLGDPEAIRNRDAHVHTLGNLTLVPEQLDAVRTNRPWIVVDHPRSGTWEVGKRDLLLEQNHLHLNARLALHDQETWTEKDIARRTSSLTHHVIRLWPGPDSRPVHGTKASFATGPETLRTDQEEGYRKLWHWLAQQPGQQVVMGFAQIEEITGVALPPAAYESSMHWFGHPDNTLVRAIRKGGWRAGDVDVLGESVCFVRATEKRP